MKACFFALAVAASFPSFAQETPMAIGTRTCMEHVSKKLSHGNPDLLRIGEPSGGKVEVIDYFGQKIMARRYALFVNGRREACVTSEDGRRVLQQGNL